MDERIQRFPHREEVVPVPLRPLQKLVTRFARLERLRALQANDRCPQMIIDGEVRLVEQAIGELKDFAVRESYVVLDEPWPVA